MEFLKPNIDVENALLKGTQAKPFVTLANQGIKSNRISTHLLKGKGISVLKSALMQKPVIATEQEIGRSYLNTPIYDNMVIQPYEYSIKTIDANGNTVTETTEYRGIRVDTVIFDVSQTKNIVTTQVQGRSGTIKEYISDGDFIISARGAIVNEDNIYPERDVKTLINICKVPDALKITSPFLNNIFGIQEVVIMNYRLNQSEGFRNLQLFELTLQSDIPIQLRKFIIEPVRGELFEI